MKLKSILLIIFCIQAIILDAQETYKITYERFSNGKKVEEMIPVIFCGFSFKDFKVMSTDFRSMSL